MMAYIVHGIFKPSFVAVQHSAVWSIPLLEQSEVSEKAIPILHAETVARASPAWEQPYLAAGCATVTRR
jgi:hypothetical protein